MNKCICTIPTHTYTRVYAFCYVYMCVCVESRHGTHLHVHVCSCATHVVPRGDMAPSCTSAHNDTVTPPAHRHTCLHVRSHIHMYAPCSWLEGAKALSAPSPLPKHPQAGLRDCGGQACRQVLIPLRPQNTGAWTAALCHTRTSAAGRPTSMTAASCLSSTWPRPSTSVTVTPSAVPSCSPTRPPGQVSQGRASHPGGGRGPQCVGAPLNTHPLLLVPGRQLVFFKTGWSHVVPDANRTTYVRAAG